MPDNFVGTFQINVMNAANPTLGQNGQGVCGVVLNFDHEYLGDLSITLTSPAGQSVQLVGPIGFWGPTDGTSWNVTFLPCGDPAVSPDPGFSNQWNNNQNWGLNGSYSGAYYPAAGCLQNFNTGSVNGTWSLTVVDGQANDVGNFYDYEIIFCDPSGIDCFSCGALAGDLPQQDVTACQGSNALILDFPPTYMAPLVAPPSPEYGYTYAIGGPGGTLLEYQQSLDLTGYDPGVYTVCGVSFLAAQEANLPAPGSMTLMQMAQAFNSNMPPLCAKMTTNCVNITINAAPENVEETQTVCAPNCYFFYGQTYCSSGTYVRNLTQNNCPYTATLYLTVIQPVTINLAETICAGSCATTPGFEAYCDPGIYTFTTQSAWTGCDSTTRLNLTINNVIANIVPPNPLPCTPQNVLLQGTGSSIGGATYQWSATNGGNIVGATNGINALINAPGTYHLLVCKTISNVSCCDSTSVEAVQNSSPPQAPNSITGPSTICPGQSQTFSVINIPGASSYTWTVPAGVTINSGQGSNSINLTWGINSPGSICVTANNSCSSSAPTCLNISVQPLLVPTAPQGSTNVCAGAQTTFNTPQITGVSSYVWTVSAPADIVSGQGSNEISVLWGNAASANVCVSAISGCGASQPVCTTVQIQSVPATPVITGNSSACAGSDQTYSIQPVNGADDYVWTVSGGIINVAPDKRSAQVNWTGALSTGSVCVKAVNECGEGQETCLDVNLGSVPVLGAIALDCNPTNDSFIVTFPVNGGTMPFSISGGSVVSGIFVSDPIPSGNSFSFTLTDALGCVSNTNNGSFNCNCATNAGSMSQQLLETCAGMSVQASFLGGAQLDANDVGAYYLHSNSGIQLGTIYAQNTTGIFSLVGAMQAGTTYYISYVVGNNTGGFPNLQDPCLSVAQGQPVIFHAYPQANAGQDGETCGLTYALLGNSGSGNWSILSGPPGNQASLSNPNQNQSTLNADVYGAYLLRWTLDNAGCQDADSILVQLNDSPQAGTLIRNCDAANENYSVSFPITGGSAPYSVNGQLLNGSSYTSTFFANQASFSFVIADDNGCLSALVEGAFNCDCATNAGTMNLSLLEVCTGETVNAQHLNNAQLDGNDTGAYFIHSSAGPALGTVYGSNTSGIFGIQTGMQADSTYYISYVVGNNVGGTPDLQDLCLSVSQGQPVIFHGIPLAQAGTDGQTCETNFGLSANLPPNTSGQWSLAGSPSGANAAFAPPDAPQSIVSVTEPGLYTFAWTLNRFGCSHTDQISVAFSESPQLVAVTRDCDAASENYTVSLNITGGTQPYLVNGVPANGALFVSTPFPNGANYNFAVTDANGCKMPDVSGAYSCNCITSAGSMPLDTLQACEGSSITVSANMDQQLDGNDITVYVLHNGSGNALGSQFFAQNKTGVFSFVNGMEYDKIYHVSLVAGNNLAGFPDPNDPCFAVSAGQPVRFLKMPEPQAGTDITTCGNETVFDAPPSLYNGAWNILNAATGVSITGMSDPKSVVHVSNPGVYAFEWQENNQGCIARDTVQVSFNALPIAAALDENCNPDNLTYTLSFVMQAGASPFAVSGLTGTFSGNNFTSEPIPNNSAYTFHVKDANGCESLEITGIKNCNCLTDAGSLQAEATVFCAGDDATVLWNNDAQLDPNDKLSFILHNSPGTVLDTIYAYSDSPSFPFNNHQIGKIYYISVVAGNAGGALIDLNDPCLSVSPGIPVQWIAPPAASISGDATICAGSTVSLTISGQGQFPLELTWSDATGSSQVLQLNNSTPVLIPVQPSASTQYKLIAVKDGSAAACTSTLNESVSVTVHQPVSAGLATDSLDFCEGIAANISLPQLLNGASLGGQWSQVQPATVPGPYFNATTAAFNTAIAPVGIYALRYTVTGQAPCPSDNEDILIAINPNPVADAGQDKTLTCIDTLTSLGGIATTAGPGIRHLWVFNGDTVGQQLLLTVSKGGLYALKVENTFGCKGEDLVSVFAENTPPQAIISLKMVRCFGEKNGAIAIDSIIGGKEPVLIALNQAAFSNNTLFDGLSAGQYSVTLQDANGCEWHADSLYISQPTALQAELGIDLKVNLSDTAHVNLLLNRDLAAIDTIIWSPLLDPVSAGQPYQHFTPFQTQEIKVNVTDTAGCAENDKIRVFVDRLRHVFIPNAIKPGDDNNGIAVVFGGRDVEEVVSFQIFDRWGDQVFGTQHFKPNLPEYGWDGRYKGKDLIPGVYVYYVVVKFIDGKQELFKGDISILR